MLEHESTESHAVPMEDIFKPNNHSVWEIAYRDVTDSVRAPIESLFLKEYGHIADSITSFEQVAETEVNSNNFKVRGTKNDTEMTVLIRRYPQWH